MIRNEREKTWSYRLKSVFINKLSEILDVYGLCLKKSATQLKGTWSGHPKACLAQISSIHLETEASPT